MSNVNTVVFTIVLVLFVIVTVVGFPAARWRRAENMLQLNEWGLAGRGFGTFITWFLLGGDLYTAYTFIAVPALVFGSGSIGFFAVSYTIMAYPIAFIFLPRLWSVCRVHDYVTPGDFIRGRYGSRGLALAMAFTGILALMPYIALQLVGIQSVLTVMGVGSSSNNTYVKDLPLFVAFLVLADLHVRLRAARARRDRVHQGHAHLRVRHRGACSTSRPGWAAGGTSSARPRRTSRRSTRRRRRPTARSSPPPSPPAAPSSTSRRWRSAPPWRCSSTRTSSPARWPSKRRSIIKRNMSLLPAYSVLLGLIALFGYMAVADPVTAANVKKAGNPQLAVPYLFQHMFPSWFTGIAFAGIIIGALVPAAIMAIAAANLFTRNIFKEFFKPDASPALETRMSQWASLVVKFGALVFAVELPHTFSINLQLLGGVWILQIFPMLVVGLYTRWFHRWALLTGWVGRHDLRHARRVQRQERRRPRTGRGRRTSCSGTASTSASPRSSSTS